MINFKRAVVLLPVYVAAMITVDIVFKSAHVTPTGRLPVWIVGGFIASAILIVALGIWYFVRRDAGTITPKRENGYIAVIAGVGVAGFVGDSLSGVAGRFMGGKSLWVMAPSYAVAYVVLLWTIVLVTKSLGSRTDDVGDRTGSSH